MSVSRRGLFKAVGASSLALLLAGMATVLGLLMDVLVAMPAMAWMDLAGLKIGGEARVRYESRVGATFGAAAGNLSVPSHRIRLNIGYDLTPKVSFFMQIQDARFYGSEADSANVGGFPTVSSTNRNGTGVDLHQGYLQVKNLAIPGLTLTLGRQEIFFGDHRLFGNFNWSQTGAAFDGARLIYARDPATLHLFWARPFDNEGRTTTSNTGVPFPSSTDRGTQDQDVYGAYLVVKAGTIGTVEPYYFYLKDSRAPGTTTSIFTAQAASQSRGTLGLRLNGKGGGFDGTAEGAYQFGSISSGAGAPGDNLAINADAEAVKLGYTAAWAPMTPRLGLEFDYASGDGDNASGAHRGNFNTFDNLYPTNHFHYGHMDLMAWKNMVNYRATLDFKPTPDSKLQFDAVIHRLANARDHWYRAAQAVYGRSAPTNQAASLGQEVNVHYWHTLEEQFKIEIGYGHFFAGEYLDKARAGGTATVNGVTPGGADQDWGYVMGSVSF